LKVELGSDSETWHDGNQVISTKAEDVIDKQEKDPISGTFTVIKTT
jgi:hypothetical protein